MSTLLTIAIPFYNAEKYFAQTIDSVLVQTYSEFEVLLVDDGSTDSSMQIARKYAALDSRVKIFSDGENKNLGFRLNQIPSLVSTPYLARMDADDIMHPQKIEKQMQVLLEHPEIDVLGTNVYSIDENDTVVGIRNIVTKEKYNVVHSFCHPTIIAKTQWFTDNPYDVQALRIEDAELWLKNTGKANFQEISEPLFFYREFGNKYWKKYFKGNSAVWYVLKKHNFSIPFLKFAFRYYIAGIVYFCFDIFGKEQKLINKRNAVQLQPKNYKNYL